MIIKKSGRILMGVVLAVFLAATLMSCATTEQLKVLETQVQQAMRDAQEAKSLAQDCSMQVKQADAAALRAESAADRAEAAAGVAEVSAVLAADMALKSEAIFNKLKAK
jgi:hypothetical protein